MANKKKILTAAIALGTAAALTLGGTFAWQSISQTALNESSDVINPGGRLHDDFDGSDKNVYVENFAKDDIFARVRLEEYFEIVLNAGTKAEKSFQLIGTKTETEVDDDIQREYEYEIFKGYDKIKDGVIPAANVTEGEDEKAVTTSWWNWNVGGKTVFMPTFNKNKDSLKADINGEYLFDTGVLSSRDNAQYSEMAKYEVGDEATGNAIYDADSNNIDEIDQADLAKIIAGDEAVDTRYAKTKNETHTAKETATAQLISMTEWLNMVGDSYNKDTHGNYWVYDEDGWVYWSAPIAAGEATGLLLDGISLSDTMDNSWYYAINVVGQFVTADDVGKNDGTGFYDGYTAAAAAIDENDEEAEEVLPVSKNAEKLLKLIGVQFDDETAGGNGDSDSDKDDNKDDEEEVKDGIYLSLTQAPCDVTTTTDEDGNTVLCCLIDENIENYGSADFQLKTEYWDNGTDKTNDYTYTYTIKSGKYGEDSSFRGDDHDPATFTVSEADGEGKVTLTGSAEKYNGTFDTTTNTLTMPEDTLYSFELTVELTISDGEETIETKTFKLGCAAAIHLYTYSYEGEPNPGTEFTMVEGSTSQTMPVGGYSVAVFYTKTESVYYNWQIEFSETIGCDAIEPQYGEGEYAFEHAEEGCTGLGTTSTVKAYMTNYPWNCAEYTLTCSEAVEYHTLKAKDWWDGDTHDVDLTYGSILFEVELDYEALESGDNLTAKLYHCGDTGSPVAEWSGSEITYDEASECMWISLVDKDVPLSIGEMEYDLYVFYQLDEDTTLEADVVEVTVKYSPVVMTEEGATAKVKTHEATLLALDGVDAPLAGYSTSNSFINNVTVKTSDGQTVVFEKVEESDQDGKMDEEYKGSDISVEFNYKGNLIMIWTDDPCTVEITLNEKTYTVNFVKE